MRREFTLQLYDRPKPRRVGDLTMKLTLDTKEFAKAMRRFAKACEQIKLKHPGRPFS